MPKRKGSYLPQKLETSTEAYNETGRPIGERMNNPMAEVRCKEVDCLDEAMKDGAHVLSKMGMMPKR